MKLYSENKDYKLYQGSMLDMLEVIEPNTIDSVVCDPPYELNFMGKGWDNSGIAFQPDTWKKCYEVLKPGGYLLAFGGSRTFHRIACAIEDAGFEIRDTIMWLYGSGFPKSMDISKQIDKRNGKQNEDFTKFGNYLKQKREEKKLSKNDIDKIMKTNTAYSWWEGRNYLGDFIVQLPDKENYYKLKEVLNLDDRFDYLIEWQEAEREVIGTTITNKTIYQRIGDKNISGEIDITIPSTDLAKQWQGWGTALKPSFEPIIVARKPFKGSLVDNIIENGVGGINIDECRVKAEEMKPCKRGSGVFSETANGKITGWNKDDYNGDYQPNNLGRFPANTILTYDETDFDEVCGGFPYTKTGSRKAQPQKDGSWNAVGIKFKMTYVCEGSEGSASRYFYCAKASKKDRDEGLEEFEKKMTCVDEHYADEYKEDVNACSGKYNATQCPKKNIHPTVKPTSLMQYLVRLVSPKGATILDPFNGSGSTGKAVMYENKERKKNYKYIGIELTEEYLPIAKARIEYVCKLNEEKLKEMQMSIFDYLESKGE